MALIRQHVAKELAKKAKEIEMKKKQDELKRIQAEALREKKEKAELLQNRKIADKIYTQCLERSIDGHLELVLFNIKKEIIKILINDGFDISTTPGKEKSLILERIEDLELKHASSFKKLAESVKSSNIPLQIPSKINYKQIFNIKYGLKQIIDEQPIRSSSEKRLSDLIILRNTINFNDMSEFEQNKINSEIEKLQATQPTKKREALNLNEKQRAIEILRAHEETFIEAGSIQSQMNLLDGLLDDGYKISWNKNLKDYQDDCYAKKVTWIARGGQKLLKNISNQIEENTQKSKDRMILKYSKETHEIILNQRFKLPNYIEIQDIINCIQIAGYECAMGMSPSKNQIAYTIRWNWYDKSIYMPIAFNNIRTKWLWFSEHQLL